MGITIFTQGKIDHIKDISSLIDDVKEVAKKVNCHGNGIDRSSAGVVK